MPQLKLRRKQEVGLYGAPAVSTLEELEGLIGPELVVIRLSGRKPDADHQGGAVGFPPEVTATGIPSLGTWPGDGSS